MWSDGTLHTFSKRHIDDITEAMVLAIAAHFNQALVFTAKKASLRRRTGLKKREKETSSLLVSTKWQKTFGKPVLSR